MKTRRTSKMLDNSWLHTFFYGYSGTGKTKIIGDFHEAGQDVAIVTDELGEMTLDVMGIDAPILVPENEDELRAIIEQPEAVNERIIHQMPGFSSYQPKTWSFENMRTLQLMIFGQAEIKKDVEVFNGEIILPKQKATGVMALPNARDAAGVPSNKDYRLLDMKMRGVIKKIESMPYHTIVTAHAEKDFSAKTHLELTGDQKKDKEVPRTLEGYPSLEGFALKMDLPGLVADFYIYLESNGTTYYMCPKTSKGFYARTRLAPFMPQSIDWTNKNMYEILWEKFTQARKRS